MERWLKEGNYSKTKGINLKAGKSEGTLHPLEKNKKLEAAKLTEEKHMQRERSGKGECNQVSKEDKNLEGGMTHLQESKKKAVGGRNM